MAKPVGAKCNLDCGYCFYLEKDRYYPERERFLMEDTVLEAYVRRYIAAQPTPEVEFTWQGGEPTLRGLEFFERAVALQRQYANGKTIRNTLQTNGTFLDDAWCAFLRREGFLVGLSLDGPQAINDAARPDKQGRSSYDDTQRGLRALQRHGVDFNILVTVSSANVGDPRGVYRFLKTQGVKFMQFNPVVERMARPAESVIGLHFAKPPQWTRPGNAADGHGKVTSHSVGSQAYGDFLIGVFDEWVREDVGDVHVMNFEWALAAWCQLPATTCIFSERCGRAAIVEHDGSVYSCDHFMHPEYRLGNLRTDDPAVLIESPAQRAFGDAKADALPDQCRRCTYRFACHGECPKNRFIETADGEPGLNYLCAGYLKYFRHITPAMNRMAKLLADGRAAAEVMTDLPAVGTT
ncbi:MAG: anaerobic sulfatase maturase [Paucibacter sp.]|nr:anaerobic sulfatase maturase [Roseateles sp.]